MLPTVALAYAASWMQMPLPFPSRLLALKLARPTTRAGRIARAARAGARRAAMAIKRAAMAKTKKHAVKQQGSISNLEQIGLLLITPLRTLQRLAKTVSAIA